MFGHQTFDLILIHKLYRFCEIPFAENIIYGHTSQTSGKTFNFHQPFHLQKFFKITKTCHYYFTFRFNQ